jgi:Ca2+-binding RTX toxin-like protein
MTLTAAEQLLIELINRARLDPVAEAARLGLSLNDGLSSGTIGPAAQQILAPNDPLHAAATSHSRWMLQTDTFSHNGANGSDAGDRMLIAGYENTSPWSWSENLAWNGSTGSMDPQSAIVRMYEQLFKSPGHRENTLDREFREIGVGQEQGDYTTGGGTYNATMLTEVLALSGSSIFVSGVAIKDKDQDGFYDLGEGRANYFVSGGGKRSITSETGGYALELTPGDIVQGSVAITLGTGQVTHGRVILNIGEENAKIDLLTSADGPPAITLSATATLVSGITKATLLGRGDLDLTGSSASDRLFGNVGGNELTGGKGNDRLTGASGADKLWGGAGADKLKGEAGDDMLSGQSGRNVLTGGSGADLFVFSTGKDRITDFTDNTDTIEISARALSNTNTTVSDLLEMFDIRNGNAILVLDDGSQLTINRVSNVRILADDLLIA